MFATPCYISAVSMNYTTSIFNLVWHSARFGLDCILHMSSESLITRARNKIVRDFLADDSFTHLFFIDSDIEFTPQSVCRLLLADRDIAAGVYPMKSMNWPDGGLPAGMKREEFEVRCTSYPFNPVGHGTQKVGAFVDDDGFAEVVEAPTGFMCIKRDVFARLMTAYPHLRYTPDAYPPQPHPHLHWRFFDCTVDPDTNRYLSEDFAFCRLWREIGGKVFVDTDCRLNHLGQHMFKGHLGESLKAQGMW
jgi:hypothetical protein